MKRYILFAHSIEFDGGGANDIVARSKYPSCLGSKVTLIKDEDGNPFKIHLRPSPKASLIKLFADSFVQIYDTKRGKVIAEIGLQEGKGSQLKVIRKGDKHLFHNIYWEN